MADFVLARIKPHNPRIGNHIKTYTFDGNRFREEAGWYKVDPELGERLKDVLADDNDPQSTYVFDVLSEDEALKVEENERSRRERAASVRTARGGTDLRSRERRRLSAATDVAATGDAVGVLTTASLRGSAPQAPNDNVIPNGYPPPQAYPMPQTTGSQTMTTQYDAGVIEEAIDEDTLNKAAEAGVPDKTIGANAVNLVRDLNAPPRVVDGDDDDFPLEGDTDFGADDAEGTVRDPNDPDAPASPPSARRKKRGR